MYTTNIFVFMAKVLFDSSFEASIVKLMIVKINCELIQVIFSFVAHT